MNRATRRALRMRAGGRELPRVLAAIFSDIGTKVSARCELSDGEAARGAFELYRAGRLRLISDRGGVSYRLIDPPAPPPSGDPMLAVVADLLTSGASTHG